jgi:hypothetical protein
VALRPYLTMALRIGAAACALAGAISLTAAGGPLSIVTADGRVVTVWEAHPRSAAGDPGSAGTAIAYSVTDASGTQIGIIAPTSDAALDLDPRLALDQTGAPVVVWTRFDGTRFKISYARLGDGGWSSFHYLTFGQGDDSLPRLGTSDTGSYLFWVSGDNRFWYAPLELSGGRLLASPRGLRLGFPRMTGRGGMRGGTDVPVNIGKSRSSQPVKDSGLLLDPSGTLLQGGSDVPIVLGKNSAHVKSVLWGVGASADCHNVVLVVPDPSEEVLHVFSFTNGATAEVDRIPAPAGAQDGFAEAKASGYLATACR